jgi:GNAT superfamily N-acetyltransferase
MASGAIKYEQTRDIGLENIVALYQANGWSSADKPQVLLQALQNSHSLVTAWDGQRLIGLGNAISDGFLVVYYPHLLVLPEYQGRGIGKGILHRLMAKYQDFHQQIVLADGKAAPFYQKCGFQRAGLTEPMWIFHGEEHG